MSPYSKQIVCVTVTQYSMIHMIFFTYSVQYVRYSSNTLAAAQFSAQFEAILQKTHCFNLAANSPSAQDAMLPCAPKHTRATSAFSNAS